MPWRAGLLVHQPSRGLPSVSADGRDHRLNTCQPVASSMIATATPTPNQAAVLMSRLGSDRGQGSRNGWSALGMPGLPGVSPLRFLEGRFRLTISGR